MTTIAYPAAPARPTVVPGKRAARPAASARGPVQRSRPGPSRPAGAPLRYARPAVAFSEAPHRPRAVSLFVTAALAGAAALITLWLGSVAQSGGVGGAAEPSVPDRLAVVQVGAGESLQQVAARVAPAAPAGLVVDRILELNDLGDAGPVAGQTLIAPVG